VTVAAPLVGSAPAVTFAGVSRAFGSVTAVDDVSFTVDDGEFFTFLGPSGSGKTTCLRLIAGFERPDRGTVTLSGRVANDLPPFERDVHTVFQDYALFPHMNVLDNVAYGLMVRGVDRATRRRRAEEALAMVRLEGLGHRRPAQLSGGQRQRVALARALVGRPKVLLLDEPLGALDLKLREQMQVELKALQHQVGITFVYVTHDQQEALSMSDRIAVFNHGRIDQLGTPADVYDHPTTAFVAGFVGASNLVDGELARRLTGSDGPYMVRPERIRIVPEGGDDGALARGRIAEIVYLGMHTRYHVRTDDGARLLVDVQNLRGRGSAPELAIGAPVALGWPLEHMHRVER
jgi:putative spermidine/putrescine transport system ATP-binding protein